MVTVCNCTVVHPRDRLDYVLSRPIFINGHKIKFYRCLVYLKVIIDMHLSWMPYLNAAQKRSFKLLHKMDHLTVAN